MSATRLVPFLIETENSVSSTPDRCVGRPVLRPPQIPVYRLETFLVPRQRNIGSASSRIAVHILRLVEVGIDHWPTCGIFDIIVAPAHIAQPWSPVWRLISGIISQGRVRVNTFLNLPNSVFISRFLSFQAAESGSRDRRPL